MSEYEVTLMEDDSGFCAFAATRHGQVKVASNNLHGDFRHACWFTFATENDMSQDWVTYVDVTKVPTDLELFGDFVEEVADDLHRVAYGDEAPRWVLTDQWDEASK